LFFFLFLLGTLRPFHFTTDRRQTSHTHIGDNIVHNGTVTDFLPRTTHGEHKLLTAVSGSRQLRVVVLVLHLWCVTCSRRFARCRSRSVSVQRSMSGRSCCIADGLPSTTNTS